LDGNYLDVSKQLMVLFDPSRDPYLIWSLPDLNLCPFTF
jgi:hypothetical protein